MNMRRNKDVVWQLFNLKNDPSELHDLAADHPAVIQRMSEIQQEAHQHPHIREWEFIDPKFAGRAE